MGEISQTTYCKIVLWYTLCLKVHDESGHSDYPNLNIEITELFLM